MVFAHHTALHPHLIAAAVQPGIAAIGHPVADRYVRSMRSMQPLPESGVEALNGASSESVCEQLRALSARELPLALLREATAPIPALPAAAFLPFAAAGGALGRWARFIAAARQGALRETWTDLEATADEAMRRAASQLLALYGGTVVADSGPTGRATHQPIAVPAPETAPAAPAPTAVVCEPTPRPSEPTADALPEQVASLELTARKTGDPIARAALYHRIGCLHDNLGAPRSALESYLLAFMLDARPYAHFAAVERACREAERFKDLVHVYQTGVEVLDEGAAYPESAAALLWRCLQVQQSALLREADAENTAARLALEPSADEPLLAQLLGWLESRNPVNESLAARVRTRLQRP